MEDVMEELSWPMEETNSMKPMRESRTASSDHYSISQENMYYLPNGNTYMSSVH